MAWAQQADLQVTKTDGVTVVQPGQLVTYTIEIRNNGPVALGVNEVQTVTVTGGAGTFFLTFSGQTTPSLAFNAPAAQVQTALNALSSIGGVGGSVTVVLAASVYTVTFGGSLAQINVPQMTASGAGGATAVVATTTNGVDCATNVLVNTATAAVPAGVTDPNPSNNSATDTDVVAAPTPTLGEWGQILMVAFVVATALWMMRRRRPASA